MEVNSAIRIKSIEANRVYQVNNGYTYTDGKGKIRDCKLTFGEAVINDGIFLQYMRQHVCMITILVSLWIWAHYLLL